MISNIIQIGCRVELCMVQQIEQERRTGVRAHVYKSQVTDIFEDGSLELVMPMEAGKLILLPISIRFEFVFYCSSGMYRCIGVVTERYKSNNMYMFCISLKSPLRKFQRREYYRIPCIIDIVYYDITPEQAVELPQEQYPSLIELPEVGMTRREGSILDISGGGLRFVTDVQNKNDSYILAEVQIQSKGGPHTYLIPVYILSSAALPGDSGRFENRAEFIIRDSRIREEIIRYIFDEERRMRNKELRNRMAAAEKDEQEKDEEAEA